MRLLLGFAWAALLLNAQTLVLPDATHSCGPASYGASNSITANNCVIAGPGTVVFQAGNQIRLEDGFRATGGVGFHALIGMQPVNSMLSPKRRFGSEPIIHSHLYRSHWVCRYFGGSLPGSSQH